MRIALASIHPRPLSGQIEGLVGLAQSLEQRGHSVEVVSAFPSDELLGEARLRLATKPRRLFVDEPLRMMGIIGELAKVARSADVIQLNLPTPAFSMVADILQGMTCTPVVVGFEAHLVNAGDLLRLDRLLQAPIFYLPRLLVNNRLVARLSGHRAAHYIVSSRFQRDELVALGVSPKRIRLLPNVLPNDKFRSSTQSQIDAQLPPRPRVTYVGHYNHVKGVDVLVRAFKRLSERMQDLHLVLAWSGLGEKKPIEEARREARLNGRVVELGKVQVSELFAASDVVVLPYRLTIGQAAYPATLLEALVANVPVVTTNLPLLRELTLGGRTARLAEPDDPVSLADEIECVLRDPGVVREMLDAQRQWKGRVDPQRVVQGYEQLYAQVTAQPATALQPARNCE